MGNGIADYHELAKSMVFMGIMKGTNAMLGRINAGRAGFPPLTMTSRIDPSVAVALTSQKQYITTLLVEWGVIGASSMGSTLLVTPEHFQGYTIEEYIQGVMLSAIARGAVRKPVGEKETTASDTLQNGYGTYGYGGFRFMGWKAETMTSEGKIFSPESVKGKDFQALRDLYQREVIAKRTKPELDRVSSLKDEIIRQNGGKQIEAGTVVTIPMYAKESTPSQLLGALKNQLHKDFHTVIYVNGPKSNISAGELAAKIAEVQRAIPRELAGKVSVVSHLYETKPTMGELRSDMNDAVVMSMSSKSANPKIVGLDADTYQLGTNYVGAATRELQKPGVDLTVGKVRFESPNAQWQVVSPYIRLSEMLMHISRTGQRFESGQVTSFSMTGYLRAKWYERSSHLGEDLIMWQKIMAASGGNASATLHNQKVTANPRRAEMWIGSGNGTRVQDQWGGEFKPVDMKDVNPARLQQLDALVQRMSTGVDVNGAKVSPTDIKSLSEIINQHLKDLSPLEKGVKDPASGLTIDARVSTLMRYWSQNMSKGGYEVRATGERTVEIVEKSVKL